MNNTCKRRFVHNTLTVPGFKLYNIFITGHKTNRYLDIPGHGRNGPDLYIIHVCAQNEPGVL